MFALVDLESQAHAVSCYVHGWPKEAILAWLGQQGELLCSPAFGDLYGFRSPVGFRAVFRLDNDQFTFIADHTVWQP